MRDLRLDVGRCLAALFVVYVHFTGGYVSAYSSLDLHTWLTADVLNCMGRVCVPLFIMMSGALIVGRPIPDWAIFMRKRSAATLKPYAFGTAFYFLWQAAYGVYPASAYEYAKSIVLGGGFFHLYFLFILLVMYIITPLLQGIEAVSDKALWCTIALLFALAVIDRHIAPLGFSLGYVSLGIAMSYLPYFLLGYAMYRRKNLLADWAIVGFIGSTLVTIVAVWSFSAFPIGPYTADNFIQYTSVNVVVQSAFAFSLLLKIKSVPAWCVPPVEWFADKSLGVYIIHYAVMRELVKIVAFFYPAPVVAQLVLYPISAFLISSVIVWGAHKVPKVKGFL